MRKNPKAGLVIDIDDTLSTTASYCLEKIYEKFSPAFPHSPSKALEDYLQPGNIPQWQQEEQIQLFIRNLLNNSAFLRILPQYHDAAVILHRLHKLIPIKLYLSSRLIDYQAVTTDWLRHNCFPKAPVVCRNSWEKSPDWKFHYIASRHSTLNYLIDNDLGFLPVNSVHQNLRLIWFNPFRKLQRNNLPLVSLSSWNEIETYFRETCN